MSDVSVLYSTSLVLRIWLNGSLYLLNLNSLTRFFRLQQLNGKMMNHVSLLDRNVLLMKPK